jgi:hypothetical protein
MQRFDLDDLARCGVPRATVRAWRERRLISPESVGRGPGQGARFTFAEVCQAVAAYRLGAFGIPGRDALPACEIVAALKGGYLTLSADVDDLRSPGLEARTLPNGETLLAWLAQPRIAAVAVIDVAELQRHVVETLGLPSYPEVELPPLVVIPDESDPRLDAGAIYARRKAAVSTPEDLLRESREAARAAGEEHDNPISAAASILGPRKHHGGDR